MASLLALMNQPTNQRKKQRKNDPLTAGAQ